MTPDPVEPSFSGTSSPTMAWDSEAEAPPPSGTRVLNLLVMGAAILGVVFSSVSTSDFMQFLDRQVHSIHCSFVPGGGSEMGESGCRTVMMSPYSSYFRESWWGGIPVALWALAVFAYIAYRAGALAWKGTSTRQEAVYLVASTGLPLGMSLIFWVLSMKIGATCKVCVGMYVSSVASFVLAVLAMRRVPADPVPQPFGRMVFWFAQGVGFVLLLTVVYLSARPGNENNKSSCGALVRADDPSGVMIELKSGKAEAIEVLDPLCPSCKAFDTRLASSGVGRELQLKGLLFPLDSTCNWMVTEELHPGACAVSEAILCAAGLGEKKDYAAARKVLAYAFAHQDSLRADAKADQKAMRAALEAQFPEVKGCLGGPQVKNKIIRSLRWAVANGLPVLTPQLFVGDKRMCDEDTDLGLEYSLRTMLRESAGAKGAQK